MKDTPIVKWKFFIPWLQSQPEDRSFEYTNCRDCMIATFLKDTHGIEVNVSSAVWSDSQSPLYPFSDAAQPIPREIAAAVLSAVANRAVTIKAVKDRLT